ncbi:MAG: hypothetical protein ACYC0V_13555 [Armatimonadota bacterium]
MDLSAFEFSHRHEVKAARNDLILMTAVSVLAIVIVSFVHNPMWRVLVTYSIIILGMGVLANLIRLAATIYQMRIPSGNAPEPANVEASEDEQPNPATHSISINMQSWNMINLIIVWAGGYIGLILAAKEPMLGLLLPIIQLLMCLLLFVARAFPDWNIYRIKVLYLLGILIVLFSISGLYYTDGTFPTKTGVPDMAKISELSGLRFPSGTRVTNSASYAFIKHYEFIAVLELNPGQTDMFLDDIRKDSVGRAMTEITTADRVLPRRYRVARYVPEPDWWDADSVQKSTSAKIEYENAKVELMVSLDDPMKPRVYMVGEGYAGWIPARTATKTNHTRLHSRNGNMR